jgi:hypothetical protein
MNKQSYWLIILFCLYLHGFNAQASEITGSISTDPSQNTKPAQDSTSTEPKIIPKKSGGAVPFYLLSNNNIKPPVKTIGSEIKVLGTEHYPDNSLLRDQDQKIYLVAGRYKRTVINLTELKKYRGQTIYNVDTEVLEQYDILKNWQLIKTKGDPKVYVIRNSRKIWIPNMTEFKRYFSGDKILELNQGEINVF